jgi:FAD/FMN-containing dehydrogenase
MATTSAAADLDGRLAALRHRVDGDVLVPRDPGYADAAGRRHDPGVVVVAADVGDVIAAARYATELGVGLGSPDAAESVTGVLLDTSGMDDVEVDPEERTAWVAAGARWSDVLAAGRVHGLAPVTGSATDAGAVGSTLAGGVGWLARRYGVAGDAVKSFEVVSPDGELVRCCRDEHTELFRSLLAGDVDGNGVVTEMEIELVPVSTVYAGDLSYPVAAAAELVMRWSAWAPTTPDELTSSLVVMGASPAVVVRGCWCGELDDGRTVLDDWRAIMAPVADTWRTMPVADLAAITRDDDGPDARRVEIRHVGGSNAERQFVVRVAGDADGVLAPSGG